MKFNFPFILLLFFSLLTACLKSNAQNVDYNKLPKFLKANNNWIFGDYGGVNYNNGNPVPVGSGMTAMIGSASVSDPLSGDLLFYSNGNKVWNSAHLLMPNGSNLLGNPDPPSFFGSGPGRNGQGVCIVPVIGTADKFYLFSLNGSYRFFNASLGNTNSLYYNIIDMNLANGLGDIVPGQKNIPLDNDTLSQCMIAIPGACNDIWLIVAHYDGNRFKAYHITSSGIDINPVVSSMGLLPIVWDAFSAAASPDRSMVAFSNNKRLQIYGSGNRLLKFNPLTGIFSDCITFNKLSSMGIAFSPDNSKLYLTHGIFAQAVVSQFNLNNYDSNAIAASIIDIGFYPVAGTALRLYNDTLYVQTMSNLAGGAGYPGDFHRIVNPNQIGTACGFQNSVFSILASSNSYIDIGNDVVYPFLPDSIYHIVLDTLICTDKQEAFNDMELSATGGYDVYEWNDGSSQASKTIGQPGTYWVQCFKGCNFRVDTFKVRYIDVSFTLGPDTILCNKDTHLLQVNIPDATFLWQDGSTENAYTVNNESGYFSVTVSRDGCVATDEIYVYAKNITQDLGEDMVLCKEDPIHINLTANLPDGAMTIWSTGSNEASIIVSDTGTFWLTVIDPPCQGKDTICIIQESCDCYFQMPNAFSPNNDGLNDVFLPLLENGCPVSGYVFNVFNRFGERVFAGSNPTQGWDGTYKGALAEMGTYFFEIHFKGSSRNKPFYQKGDLTLIR